MSTVSTKRARVSTGGVAPYPSSSTKLDLKGDCTCGGRSSAVGCWSKNILAQKNDRQCLCSPRQHQQQGWALTQKYLRSQQRRQAHAQQGVRSRRQYQQHSEALVLGQKHLDSQREPQAHVPQCPVLATAAVTILRGADEKITAVATVTEGSCTAVSALATAVTAGLRGADAEVSAVATATAGSGRAVGTLTTAVPTALRALATATPGSCTAAGTLATAVPTVLRGDTSEHLRSQQRR